MAFYKKLILKNQFYSKFDLKMAVNVHLDETVKQGLRMSFSTDNCFSILKAKDHK